MRRILAAISFALTLLFSDATFAGNSTLSSLSAGIAVSGSDLFYDVQTVGNGGVKVTGSQLATFIFGQVSGDCTATSGGSLTCLKTNGTALGSIATLVNGSSTGSIIYWGGSSWLKLSGNASGTQCLQENASGSPSWGTCGGGGGTPGGSNTQLQYNNSSAFGGISGATTNGTAVTFASGDLMLSGASSGATTLNAASAAGTTTATLPNNTGTIAELNMSQTWSAAQTFTSGDFLLSGATSGTTTVNATAIASGTLTLPAATDTVVARATTDTLTNKTITSSTDSLGGVTAAFGSDAKGDTYYNTGSSNVIGNLAIGTTGQLLTVSSGIPSWASNITIEGTLTTTGSIISKVRSSSSATVTASATTDYFFCLDPTSNAIALDLPASPATGLTYLVKDCTGQAATHNITVTPAAGNIDGSATFVMNTNYQSIGVTYTGSQWSVN